MNELICHLQKRDLWAQATYPEELNTHLQSQRIAYAGFDPTANSLHAGHLLPIISLMRWQKFGHQVIALIGGGTGYIGDPSGKSEMRSMLEQDTLQSNIKSIKTQLQNLLRTTNDQSQVLNNYHWLKDLNYLEFLREMGPHFNVNKMLSAECYKQRMEDGLTFLEFNYMILQSFDFYYLYKNYDCTVQLGGDDQWSNMLGGVSLIRKKAQAKAFCITSPLLLTSDGKKMGKTQAGALWLDPEMTSPYDFYQYWRNVADVDIKRCLNYLTFLDDQQVHELAKLEGKEINQAKEVLAFEVTKLVHGESEANQAQQAARTLFDKGSKTQAQTPEVKIQQNDLALELIDFLVKYQIFSSKGEARRMIKQGGLYFNDQRVEERQTQVSIDFFEKGVLLVRKGKKKYFKLVVN